jgi:hypothetical protein
MNINQIACQKLATLNYESDIKFFYYKQYVTQ